MYGAETCTWANGRRDEIFKYTGKNQKEENKKHKNSKEFEDKHHGRQINKQR